MDFTLTEPQEAIQDLGATIFGRRSAAVLDNQRWLQTAPPFDRDLWKELADANLLGLAVPEQYGGSGHGMIELALLLEQAGQALARVPLVDTLVAGALTVARFGREHQVSEFLPGVVSGEIILTSALSWGHGPDPDHVPVVAHRDGQSWRLKGDVSLVPFAAEAVRVIVPARTSEGVELFLVAPTGAGVELRELVTTDGTPEYVLALNSVVSEDDRLPGGASALVWARQHVIAGLSALQLGIAEQALRLTADYTSRREQFGRPIATFQAVSVHAANAYIDVEAMRVTMLQAAWRLAAGLPADLEVSVAKLWAAEGGQRVVARAHHLHGGIGVDTEYPLHRYLLASKRLELSLGSAGWHLARIGDHLARTVTTQGAGQ